MQKKQASITLFLTSVLIASLAAPVALGQTTSDTEYYYGVEYDWTSLDSDIENFTGININEIFTEIMGAADDAGFNLDIAQINTGSSNVYVHYSEDMSPQTIQDKYDNDVDVWSRTNDVTLRHGVIATGILMTDWDEQTFGGQETAFDIDIQSNLEQVLTVDMVYTEYLDEDSHLIGADLDFAMNVEFDAGLSIDVLLKGDGEELPVDFDASIELGYEIQGAESEWRLGEPSSLYVDFSSGDMISWNCGEERYVEDWWGEIYMEDDCSDVSGDYSATVDYALSLTGIPTEDLGLDQGQFDLSVSDELSNSGSFEFEYLDGFDFMSVDTLTIDLGDGEETDVSVCDQCPPGQPLMFGMMASTIAGVSADLGEAISEDLEDNLLAEDGLIQTIIGWSEIDEGGDDWNDHGQDYYWYCENGEEIYTWDYANGYEDCSDGSDEPEISVRANAYDGTITLYSDYEMEEAPATIEFECSDGSETIDFDYVNDGEADCTDGSDESVDETDEFMCEDGEMIPFSWVNDGMLDCAYGMDEGVTAFGMDVTLYIDGSPEISETMVMCHGYGTWNLDECDGDIYDSIYLYEEYDLTTMDLGYGEHELCATVSLSGENVDVSNYNAPCSQLFIGAQMNGLRVNNEDMTQYYQIYMYNSPAEGETQPLTLTIFDEEGNVVETIDHTVDEYTYGIEDMFIAPAEGEYCYEAALEDDEGYVYQTLFACETAEAEPEPSDRLVAVFEALAESGLPDVLEDFGMNLEDRLSGVVADEFPYEDGMWAPMWSNQHATIVGVGVYAMDANGDWYVLVGPETQDFSNDPPAKVSIRYITGVEAMNAQATMAESNDLSAIVDLESYDLDALEEALEQAGADTSNLDLGNEGDTTNEGETTADDAADAEGLLPFLSPLSVMSMLCLAFFVGLRGKDEE
jgi:hypothetical protein